MAFIPFVETDKPTMANFNEKFQSAINEAKTSALASGVKIQAGSYQGTGDNGKSNPNSITCDFVPIVVLIMGKYDYVLSGSGSNDYHISAFGILTPNGGSCSGTYWHYHADYNPNTGTITSTSTTYNQYSGKLLCSLNDKTISWYCDYGITVSDNQNAYDIVKSEVESQHQLNYKDGTYDWIAFGI